MPIKSTEPRHSVASLTTAHQAAAAKATKATLKTQTDEIETKLAELTLASKPAYVTVVRGLQPPPSRETTRRKAADMTRHEQALLMAAFADTNDRRIDDFAELVQAQFNGGAEVKQPSLYVKYDDKGNAVRRVKGPTIVHGKYGAFALVLREDGVWEGAKVFRTGARANKDKHKTPPKTSVITAKAYKEEYAVVEEIDSPLQRRDQIKHDGRLIAITDLMLGDGIGFLSTPFSSEQSKANSRTLFHDIAYDLQTAGKSGYLHLDVKVDNIFLSRENGFVLGDWGFATKLDENGTVSRFAGTLPYAPPEVFSERPYDGRADVYALGWAVAITATQQNVFNQLSPKDPEGMAYFYDWYRGMPKNAKGLLDTELLLPRTQDGKIDEQALSNLDRHDQILSRYFGKWCSQDPELGPFVLQRMLNPRPSARCSVDECVKHADKVWSPSVQKTVNTSFEAFSKRDPRALDRRKIEAYAKVFFRKPIEE